MCDPWGQRPGDEAAETVLTNFSIKLQFFFLPTQRTTSVLPEGQEKKKNIFSVDLI